MTAIIFTMSRAIMMSMLLMNATVKAVPINAVVAQFDVNLKEDLVRSVNMYLERFIGKENSVENRHLAEDFLRSLNVVLKADCSYENNNGAQKLVCKLIARRTIHKINIANLPASLLESELRRRLSIDVGQTIDVDETIKEVLITVKSRVETFLRKNGFYDAKVTVGIDAPKETPWIDVNIDIVGGVFARVENVTVSGDFPFPSSIKKLFLRMGFSFQGIIKSVLIRTLGLYSVELERETTQSIQDRLAKMGYVQSQIRVSHQWVSADDKSASKICQSIDGKPPQFRCINLRVSVDKGPLFRWRVNVKDQISISRNALQRFIATIFSVDQLSRVSTSYTSDEMPFDQVIIEEDLLNKTTFISSKNVDEQELSESAGDIKDFLVSRGYANAEVVPSLVQEDEENVLVTFEIYADKPFFVKSVSILPSIYSAFIEQESLYNLVAPRSFTSNGNLSYAVIESAKEEVKKRLQLRGFNDLNVNVDMETVGNGAVKVIFYVSSSEREIVDEILIINDEDELSEEVLPLLSNCDNFVPKKRRIAMQKLCEGSSFVPKMITEDSVKIVDHYQTNGFLYTKVASEIIKTKKGNKIVFRLYDSRLGEDSLSPLTRQTINDIIISGNSKTSTNVIKRLFPKERKSQIRDPLSIKKGLAKLRESGRFSRIDHKIVFGQKNSDDAYSILQVAERPSLSLDASVAFSTDQYFSFDLELEEANLFSSMIKLNTTLAMGLFWGRQSILSNKIIWPYILGYPLRLTIHAPSIIYEDRLHLSNPMLRLRSRVSFRLDWRLTPVITPYLEYWLVFTQENKNVSPLTFPSSLRSLDGLIPTIRMEGLIQGVLKPGITFMDLDNLFDPHAGVDVNLWVELSGGPLLGKPPFTNLGIQNRFFIPLGPLTLALQATFMRAFIEPGQDNFQKLSNVSVMDKLGGDRSVRGYARDTIGITEFTGTRTQNSGYFLNLANVELRFPITTKSTIGNFSGALFVDQGMLIPCGGMFRCASSQSIASLAARRGLGLSIGAALRYSLPVGPVSLDYGISPITGDNRVHILFGYSF